MTLVYLALAALVILGVVMVLTGRWDAGVAHADRPQAEPLPEGPWHAEDVQALRFRVGLRGYRMQDVDAALAALAAELRRRDESTPSTGQARSLTVRPSDPPGTAPEA